MKKYGRSGWYGERHRHYLAAKGISTRLKSEEDFKKDLPLVKKYFYKNLDPEEVEQKLTALENEKRELDAHMNNLRNSFLTARKIRKETRPDEENIVNEKRIFMEWVADHPQDIFAEMEEAIEREEEISKEQKELLADKKRYEQGYFAKQPVEMNFNNEAESDFQRSEQKFVEHVVPEHVSRNESKKFKQILEESKKQQNEEQIERLNEEFKFFPIKYAPIKGHLGREAIGENVEFTPKLNKLRKQSRDALADEVGFSGNL